jgi:ketosteroid isomerase-like protein
MSQQLLNELVAAWDRQDVEATLACFAEDGVYHEAFGPGALGNTRQGKAAIREALAAGFAAYPGSRLRSVGSPVFGSAGHAAAEWVFEYTGPDGKPAQMHGCDIFLIEGDRIKVKNAYVKYFVGG